MKRLRAALRNFFFPPPGAPRFVRLLPYMTLGLLTAFVVVSSAYAWDYTNSPPFCGETCHTMPPEYSAYQISPHARIACVECHIGREFVGNQILRKAGDIKHIVALAFKKYEFPITAGEMRPARETCEKCHSPEKFSDDSFRQVTHYGDDKDNTPTTILLFLKTGGGSKRQGLGRGIHWHIENRILYYPTDKHEQTIPYIRVYNDDGSADEFVDLESNFDPASVSEADLKEMDCITCHNRITHLVPTPEASLDKALDLKLIDPAIPEIRLKGVEVLRAAYLSQDQGLNGIAGLENYYQVYYADYYASNRDTIQSAIATLQDIYRQSVFLEQKSDWTSHPNNVGHKDFPGCFRCHDGKHLNADGQAIRLECNVCHSVPVVVGPQDFVTNIEISRGPEPESHKNPNWIAGRRPPHAPRPDVRAVPHHLQPRRHGQHVLLLELGLSRCGVDLRRPGCAGTGGDCGCATAHAHAGAHASARRRRADVCGQHSAPVRLAVRRVSRRGGCRRSQTDDVCRRDGRFVQRPGRRDRRSRAQQTGGGSKRRALRQIVE
ncbi:MAG: cytochrome c family protein [Anaerolineales bacterium]|nr:cytochrome c family protein [Anaerolineales bacterium]